MNRRFDAARVFAARLIALGALAAILAGGVFDSGSAHSAARPNSEAATSQAATARNPNVVENDEIRVLVSPGWTVTGTVSPSSQPLLKLGPHVQLAKGDYVLTLAYHAMPPSAGADSRFTQIFAMPWLNPAQTMGCSFYLRRRQQVINETLLFVNLWFNDTDSGVNQACGTPPQDGSRWFAGFVSNGTGGFFLRSSGTGCGEKAYVLTATAKTARELPTPDNERLGDIIAEASRIVSSIQYKRCPLAAGPSTGVIGRPK